MGDAVPSWLVVSDVGRHERTAYPARRVVDKHLTKQIDARIIQRWHNSLQRHAIPLGEGRLVVWERLNLSLIHI